MMKKLVLALSIAAAPFAVTPLTHAQMCDASTATMVADASAPTQVSISGSQIGHAGILRLWDIVADAPPVPHRLIGTAIAADQDWLGGCSYPGIGIGAGSGYSLDDRTVTFWIWATNVDIGQARTSVYALAGILQPAAVTTTSTTSTTTTTTTTLPPVETTTTTTVAPEALAPPEPTTTTVAPESATAVPDTTAPVATTTTTTTTEPQIAAAATYSAATFGGPVRAQGTVRSTAGPAKVAPKPKAKPKAKPKRATRKTQDRIMNSRHSTRNKLV